MPSPKLNRLIHIIHLRFWKCAHVHSVRSTRLWQPKASSEAKVKVKAQIPENPPKDARKKKFLSINSEDQRTVQNLRLLSAWRHLPVLFYINTAQSPPTYPKRDNHTVFILKFVNKLLIFNCPCLPGMKSTGSWCIIF